MILRNLTPQPQKVSDGLEVKEVSPQGLVSVTPETGFHLLTEFPKTWVVEQALVPPPP
jgi:hypothetical protein